jgi:hypothetical protein
MDHVERRHSIVLSGSIDCVFPLFTPAGEKLWVEGWDRVSSSDERRDL